MDKNYKYNIIFYEKSGCAGNKKQKNILLYQGLSFRTIDILKMNWTKETLTPFFKNKTKEDMINPFAPQIKNRILDINKLSKSELIEKMCKEPILIKRPLMEVGEHKLCGFDIKVINSLLKISICKDLKISTCQSVDLSTSA